MDNFEKNPGYFANTRSEILPYLDGKYQKCLDVGCGAGMVSADLRRRGIVQEVHGIELSPQARTLAEKNLDQVFAEDLSANDPKEIQGPYDLVLCLDVLEHMYDPWSALCRIKKILSPTGTLFVSIPNIRNFRASFPLILKGDWKYDEAGILDSTHIRFFTRKTAIQMVERAGFDILKIGSSGKQPYSKTWWLNMLTFNLFHEFFEIQYFLVAKKKNN